MQTLLRRFDSAPELYMKRGPTWIVKWSADKTEGVIIRMIDWPNLSPAPCEEGRIRRGYACQCSKAGDSGSKLECAGFDS